MTLQLLCFPQAKIVLDTLVCMFSQYCNHATLFLCFPGENSAGHTGLYVQPVLQGAVHSGIGRGRVPEWRKARLPHAGIPQGVCRRRRGQQKCRHQVRNYCCSFGVTANRLVEVCIIALLAAADSCDCFGRLITSSMSPVGNLLCPDHWCTGQESLSSRCHALPLVSVCTHPHGRTSDIACHHQPTPPDTVRVTI